MDLINSIIGNDIVSEYFLKNEKNGYVWSKSDFYWDWSRVSTFEKISGMTVMKIPRGTILFYEKSTKHLTNPKEFIKRFDNGEKARLFYVPSDILVFVMSETNRKSLDHKMKRNICKKTLTNLIRSGLSMDGDRIIQGMVYLFGDEPFIDIDLSLLVDLEYDFFEKDHYSDACHCSDDSDSDFECNCSDDSDNEYDYLKYPGQLVVRHIREYDLSYRTSFALYRHFVEDLLPNCYRYLKTDKITCNIARLGIVDQMKLMMTRIIVSDTEIFFPFNRVMSNIVKSILPDFLYVETVQNYLGYKHGLTVDLNITRDIPKIQIKYENYQRESDSKNNFTVLQKVHDRVEFVKERVFSIIEQLFGNIWAIDHLPGFRNMRTDNSLFEKLLLSLGITDKYLKHEMTVKINDYNEILEYTPIKIWLSTCEKTLIFSRKVLKDRILFTVIGKMRIYFITNNRNNDYLFKIEFPHSNTGVNQQVTIFEVKNMENNPMIQIIPSKAIEIASTEKYTYHYIMSHFFTNFYSCNFGNIYNFSNCNENGVRKTIFSDRIK